MKDFLNTIKVKIAALALDEKWNGFNKKQKAALVVALALLLSLLVVGVKGCVSNRTVDTEDSVRNVEVNLLNGSERLGLNQAGQQFAFYNDGTYAVKGFLIENNKLLTYDATGKYTVDKDGKMSFLSDPMTVTKGDSTEQWDSKIVSTINKSNWTLSLQGTSKEKKEYTFAQFDLGKEQASKLGVSGVEGIRVPDTEFFKVNKQSSGFADMDINALMNMFGGDIAKSFDLSAFTGGTKEDSKQNQTVVTEVKELQESVKQAEAGAEDSDVLVAVEQEGITLAFFKDGTYIFSGSATKDGQSLTIYQKDTWSIVDNNLKLDNKNEAVVSADILKQYGMDNLAVTTNHYAELKNGQLVVYIVIDVPSSGSQTVGNYTLSQAQTAALGVDNGYSDGDHHNQDDTFLKKIFG